MPVIIAAILPIRSFMTEIIMVLAKQWSKLEQMVWVLWNVPFILDIISGPVTSQMRSTLLMYISDSRFTGRPLLEAVLGITVVRLLRLQKVIPTAHNWRIHKNLI